MVERLRLTPKKGPRGLKFGVSKRGTSCAYAMLATPHRVGGWKGKAQGVGVGVERRQVRQNEKCAHEAVGIAPFEHEAEGI
eukprot:scaffold153350_cov30-Tisochrysis_lutea.AAC.5